MSEEPFLRNHWSVVASNLVRSASIMGAAFVVSFYSGGDGMPRETVAGIFAAFLALMTVAIVIIWKKTKFYFREDEIVVERTTLFRSTTRIQYDRLASVNVEKDVVCRLLGATKLSFNLNSSVNAARAEAYIVLKDPDAEALRAEIASRMFGERRESVQAEPQEETSLVDVSVLDIFLHSFLGMPTPQFVGGMAMLLYSAYSQFTSALSIVAILFFIMDFFLPAVSSFFRLYGYRITRSGDTVRISSGFFSTRQDSFKLSKVNFVKVREPFICRLIGKAILEVEVVGTANSSGVPLLCPLKSKGVAMALFRELLPEFECEAAPSRQKGVAMAGSIFWAASVSAAAWAVCILLSGHVAEDLYMGVLAAFAIAVTAVSIGWAVLSYRERRFSMDGSILMLVVGSYDRTTNCILLDKIQFVEVTAGPILRMHGAARCNVSMLSTAGSASVRSGVFATEVLERLSSEVLARILDGRYDFRRFQ